MFDESKNSKLRVVPFPNSLSVTSIAVGPEAIANFWRLFFANGGEAGHSSLPLVIGVDSPWVNKIWMNWNRTDRLRL
jgi:hypothetical protein